MPEAIYNELSSRLEHYISEHELTGKLPGLQKLAKILGANHITVRKAVELLVNRGRLEVIPSKGTFVCTKVPRLRKRLPICSSCTKERKSSSLMKWVIGAI